MNRVCRHGPHETARRGWSQRGTPVAVLEPAGGAERRHARRNAKNTTPTATTSMPSPTATGRVPNAYCSGDR